MFTNIYCTSSFGLTLRLVIYIFLDVHYQVDDMSYDFIVDCTHACLLLLALNYFICF